MADSANPRVTYAGPVPPLLGGIGQHGARVVEALRKRGSEVTVLSWAAQYPTFIFKGVPRSTEGSAPDGARFLLRWWDLASWVRAGRIVSRGDLLVLQYVTPFHAVPQRIMMAAAGVPVVLVVHNPLPHEHMPFDRRFAKLIFKRADHVITHSESVLDEVRRLAPGVDGQVIPLPPLLPVTEMPLPPSPPLRLLCLGFVRQYKGFDVAVDAVRELVTRGCDVRLTIAGDVWEDRDAWRARLADPALEGRVELLDGYVADADVVELLRSHQIVLLPYRSATQSGVASLAYAAGRPVVASAVGGLVEAVRDGETGRLVPPEDARALADAITEVASDLSKFAMRATQASGGWSAVADALLGGDASVQSRGTAR